VLVDLGGPVGQFVTVLAQDPAPPPGKGEEFGKASPIGLVVLVLLFLATILLIRSMNKQLRKVPASFDKPDATPSDPTTPDVTAPPSATPPSGDEPGNAPIRS
jgi:hypothetical protein